MCHHSSFSFLSGFLIFRRPFDFPKKRNNSPFFWFKMFSLSLSLKKSTGFLGWFSFPHYLPLSTDCLNQNKPSQINSFQFGFILVREQHQGKQVLFQLLYVLQGSTLSMVHSFCGNETFHLKCLRFKGFISKTNACTLQLLENLRFWNQTETFLHYPAKLSCLKCNQLCSSPKGCRFRCHMARRNRNHIVSSGMLTLCQSVSLVLAKPHMFPATSDCRMLEKHTEVQQCKLFADDVIELIRKNTGQL